MEDEDAIEEEEEDDDALAGDQDEDLINEGLEEEGGTKEDKATKKVAMDKLLTLTKDEQLRLVLNKKIPGVEELGKNKKGGFEE